MLRVLSAALVVAVGLFFVGCSGVASPVAGMFYVNAKGPLMVTGEAKGSKKGEAVCKTVFGVASGDCSIETAANNGGITKIHSVDTEVKSILGVYGTFKVIVTGE